MKPVADLNLQDQAKHSFQVVRGADSVSLQKCPAAPHIRLNTQVPSAV